MRDAALTTRGMIYASLFGALTAMGALISIPLQPVPIILSNLFLNIAAALLGGSLAALSQIIYIFLGGLGLPVFSGGKAGFGVLLGPTGGYLIGFVVGAYLMGKLIERKKAPGFAWLVFSMTVGLAVIYAVGVLQLSLVARLSLEKALTVGVLPFLPGDALKIIAASLVTLKTRDKVKL